MMMTTTRYASEFLQNVSVGRHRQCGDSQSNVIIEEFKDGREVIIVIFSLWSIMTIDHAHHDHHDNHDPSHHHHHQVVESRPKLLSEAASPDLKPGVRVEQRPQGRFSSG